jgi:hypothetical protein
MQQQQFRYAGSLVLTASPISHEDIPVKEAVIQGVLMSAMNRFLLASRVVLVQFVSVD